MDASATAPSRKNSHPGSISAQDIFFFWMKQTSEMPLLRNFLICVPETKHLHHTQADVDTTWRPFSDSFSRTSASSIGSSLPHFSHGYRLIFLTKTISQEKNTILHSELREYSPSPNTSFPEQSRSTHKPKVFLPESLQKMWWVFFERLAQALDEGTKKFVIKSQFQHFPVMFTSVPFSLCFASSCEMEGKASLSFPSAPSHLRWQ